MDKTLENAIKYIVGVDEVGRGPIAGPVAVCAFLVKSDSFLEFCIIPTNIKTSATSKAGGWKLPKLRDSKKLSKKQREIWFKFLNEEKKKGNCDFTVSFVSSQNIDKFGITKCIQKALDESLEKLRVNEEPVFIFLDGGLKADSKYLNQETIIKGDETHPVISLASIIAKVSRDRIMYRYAKEFPRYGFDKHVGYGTKAHYEAIKKYGKLPIHRESFIH